MKYVMVGPPESAPGLVPDTGQYLRAFAGVEEPQNAAVRAAVAVTGMYRTLYEARAAGNGDAVQPQVVDALAFLIFGINREVKAMLAEGPHPPPDAPEHPDTYGDEVASLAFRYFRVWWFQSRKADISVEANDLNLQIETVNALVADVRAGRVRLRLPDR